MIYKGFIFFTSQNLKKKKKNTVSGALLNLHLLIHLGGGTRAYSVTTGHEVPIQPGYDTSSLNSMRNIHINIQIHT